MTQNHQILINIIMFSFFQIVFPAQSVPDFVIGSNYHDTLAPQSDCPVRKCYTF